jgi:retron-type reverse transcriptase
MPRLATTAVASVRNPTVRGAKLDAHYRSYLLPKQSGGTRTILVPEPWLKGLQRRIYEKLLRPLGAHDCAHGFVPGRSILTNATPHVGKSVVVTCDIAKAFPSITWSLVLHALKRDLGERLSGPAISLLVDICCHAGGLPIGAPTSPALLNRVLLPADRIFAAEADKHGLSYTRYADDLTFSGGNDAPGMLRIVRRILGEIGLHLDDRKTNIFRCGRRQMVTGLSVNQRANVPRRLRRRLRAAVHRQVHGDEPQWHGKPLSLASLKGHLHFLEMIDPDSASVLLQQLQEPSA